MVSDGKAPKRRVGTQVLLGGLAGTPVHLLLGLERYDKSSPAWHRLCHPSSDQLRVGWGEVTTMPGLMMQSLPVPGQDITCNCCIQGGGGKDFFQYFLVNSFHKYSAES